ncbi:MAG: hypothetical protein RL318_2951 [Fibrobacterota bacterium]|jgi:putative RNA 2'-phosphotransferase
MDKTLVSKSKFLSLVLRHAPETIALSLDAHGWASLDELIEKSRLHGSGITLDEILEIVATNEKKRFEISLDDERIRAVQGHSITVDLELDPATPPDMLFHGTSQSNVEAILREGILRMKRQHVHLSHEKETAAKVGMRHGKPVVLKVDSGRMHREGHIFGISRNGVWLVDVVPPEYLSR